MPPEGKYPPHFFNIYIILFNIYRIPNVDELNLKNTSIETRKDGSIVVDDFQNTNVKGIYAIGDVTNNV